MRNDTLRLARGGIFVALSFILLYISTIIPINKLYILGLTAAIIPMSILSIGIQKSVGVYLATSILGVLFLGFKGNVIGYVLFFGLYGFIKLYIEKLSNIVVEIILKLVFFNISMYSIYLIIMLLVGNIILAYPLPLPVIIVILQVIFLICDYALSIIISNVDKHLLKRLDLFNR
ncbi:MAG: hypothetical protein AB6733_14640 [Clostridiaceae bacterium]